MITLQPGEWLFAPYEKRFYQIEKVDTVKNRFSYSYNDDYDRYKHSYWLDFDDANLVSMFADGDIIHVKNEHERLAMQLKYSCAI